MRNYKIKLCILLFVLISVASCNFDDEFYKNPNKPSSYETHFLYLSAANHAYRFNWTTHQYMNNWFQLYPHYLAESKQINYTKFTNQNITTIDFFLNPIKNLNKIVVDLKKDVPDYAQYVNFGDLNNQIGVSLTLKAFYMMHLTDMLGMLPYSEAFKTEDDGTPIYLIKYDTQEEIYNRLFDELNEGYSLLDESKPLDGNYERLYKGDISKWKRFNASLRMMMAIKLQNVASEKGKAEFKKAYTNGAIVNNEDNLIFDFINEVNTSTSSWLYLLYNVSKNNYYAPCETLLSQMREYSDPRIAEYCEKNSDGEYVGADLGWSEAELVGSGRNFSTINKKYWESPNSPITITSAANTLFMQAEAALIGWIDADPEQMYINAIEASFEQHNLDKALVKEYIKHPEVEFKGETQEKVKCIAMQKWIAGYLQDGIEAWSDWRRFKYPNLTPGQEGIISGGLKDGLPLRMTYAENEIKYNSENYKRVLETQGDDNVYTPLWWNK